jgi:hypothetical protein
MVLEKHQDCSFSGGNRLSTPGVRLWHEKQMLCSSGPARFIEKVRTRVTEITARAWQTPQSKTLCESGLNSAICTSNWKSPDGFPSFASWIRKFTKSLPALTARPHLLRLSTTAVAAAAAAAIARASADQQESGLAGLVCRRTLGQVAA